MELKNYTTEQIEAELSKNEDRTVTIKLFAVLQLSRGYSARELEKFYHASFKQIYNWAERFDTEGIDGLRIKAGRGRHSRLTDAQKYEVTGWLLETPEQFGYNTGSWTGPLLQAHIKKIYSVEYRPAATYKLMHDLGFSFQRSKAVYPESKEKEEERKEACVHIKKL